MSDIVKIVGISLAGGLMAMTVGQYRKEFGIVTALICAAVIFMYAADSLNAIITGLEKIIDETGVEVKYFTSVVKVVGIAYITQFGAEILRDCGENAVALKLELAGKVFIMGLTLPVIADFLHACMEAVKLI